MDIEKTPKATRSVYHCCPCRRNKGKQRVAECATHSKICHLAEGLFWAKAREKQQVQVACADLPFFSLKGRDKTPIWKMLSIYQEEK